MTAQISHAIEYSSGTGPLRQTHSPRWPDMQQRLAAAGADPPQVRTELMTRTDPATTKIIDALDSFYCYNLTAALWGR